MITLRSFDWSYAAREKAIFSALWPDGCKPSIENALRAQRAGLSLRCAAKQLLSGEALGQFEKAVSRALGAYRRVVRPLVHEARDRWREGDRDGEKAAAKRLDATKRELWPVYQERVAEALVRALG